MVSNAPSAERVRHAAAIEPPRVDASSFRQGWRVRTRLDALLAAGKIAPAVWQAAVEYRDAWARVLAGSGGVPGNRITGGADMHDRQIALLGALAVLTAIERRIGAHRTALCVACVVEDRSWPAIGRLFGCSNHTAETWTIEALRALAAAWATRQEGGRDGSTEPPERPRRVRAS